MQKAPALRHPQKHPKKRFSKVGIEAQNGLRLARAEGHF